MKIEYIFETAKIVCLAFMASGIMDIASSYRKEIKIVTNSFPSSEDTVVIDTTSDVMAFMNKEPEEGLQESLQYYDIKHPNIVYAQARLETGNFQSNIARKNNNLFGLYDSKNKRYYSYDHWSESVKAYKEMIQNRYDKNKHKTYYKFLSDIGYAEDKNYNKKLKQIIKKG